MSQDVRTRSAEPGGGEPLGGLDGLDGGSSAAASEAASDVLNRIWRFFISMRTGLWLILCLGLLSLAGTLLEQAPAGIDAQTYASFVASVHSKYGGWTPVLDRLGLFNVFTSIWFKAITVLLTTSVLACSVNRAPRLWKLAFHPRTRMSETFFTHAPLRADILLPAGPEVASDEVRKVLRSNHFRTVTDADDEGTSLYADRFRWGPFGTVIAHVSFVIILLGFFLSSTTGFKNTSFIASVGDAAVPVGHGTGLSVKAMSFNDTYYADGSPKDYVSDLVLYKNGVQVNRQMVRVNHPMTQDGVSFFQSAFGIAAAVTVTDSAGKTIYSAPVPLMYQSDDGTHSIGEFAMASQGLSVYVVAPASGKPDPNIAAGQMQLEVDQSGKTSPLATEVVNQGKPTTIAGLNYTFQRTQMYTQLIVAHDPGANFVWVGSALLVLGLVLVFFFPHRRVWVRVRKTSGDSEILCASTMKRDVAFKPQFHQMVTDIQLAGTPSSTSKEKGQNDA